MSLERANSPSPEVPERYRSVKLSYDILNVQVNRLKEALVEVGAEDELKRLAVETEQRIANLWRSVREADPSRAWNYIWVDKGYVDVGERGHILVEMGDEPVMHTAMVRSYGTFRKSVETDGSTLKRLEPGWAINTRLVPLTAEKLLSKFSGRVYGAITGKPRSSSTRLGQLLIR